MARKQVLLLTLIAISVMSLVKNKLTRTNTQFCYWV